MPNSIALKLIEIIEFYQKHTFRRPSKWNPNLMLLFLIPAAYKEWGVGGGVAFKNAIFIAFSGESRQFRPTNYNLTLWRNPLHHVAIPTKMASQLRTSSFRWMDQSSHKSMVHRLVRYLTDGDSSNFFAIIIIRANLRIIVAISSTNKPFFFQIRIEIIIDVLSSCSADKKLHIQRRFIYKCKTETTLKNLQL